MFILTNYKNLHRFIDIKSLNSKQIHLAQELSCYYFQIDYCQNKTKRAANALFQYLQ